MTMRLRLTDAAGCGNTDVDDGGSAANANERACLHDRCKQRERSMPTGKGIWKDEKHAMAPVPRAPGSGKRGWERDLVRLNTNTSNIIKI